MASGFNKDDPLFGTIDLDDEYITDAWLVDKYVGGQLWMFGLNTAGMLGTNNTTNYSSPVQVGTLSSWKQVASGGNGHTLAIDTGGRLYAWGLNSSGQLGQYGITNYSSPIQIGALTTWKQISCGYTHSSAIKTDSTLWTWGNNSNGQLGLGVAGATAAAGGYYSSPVQVGALTNWKSVANGEYYTNAIKTDGTLWAWGVNEFGQLGNNNRTYYSSPVQVGVLTTWKQVVAGRSTTAALKTDGTLWTWGANDRGQLGNNNQTYYSSPVQVGALTNWRQIETDGVHIVAVKTDGTLWTWGINNTGSLGLGFIGTPYYSSPVQVGTLTNWKYVTTGFGATLAVKTDGTLWAWGNNQFGGLGINNIVSYSSPVQIGSLTNWKSVGKSGQGVAALTFADIT